MLDWDDEPKTQATTSAGNTTGPAPVNVDDKRVINGDTDVNQLAPFKYPWAWEYFMNANKNHWTPLDVNMAQDVHDYHHRLTAPEKHVYENVLAYLTTSDILAMRNIGLAVMEKMSAPELQIYQARQVYEEAMHTWAYQHCIETLNLDQSEIYNRYRVVPAINGKIQIANRRLDAAMRPGMNLRNRDDLQEFIMSYLFFAAVFEGTWFYNGFSPIFALQRRGLMRGTGEQLQYILRDEAMHFSFGLKVVNQIVEEENITFDRKQCATCGTNRKPPKAPTPSTSCAIPSSATPRSTTANSSASWPTEEREPWAWTNPSRAPGTSRPGWMSRPPCARRRTSSKPG